MRFFIDFINKYLVMSFICLAIFIIFGDLAKYELNSADASIYLSTAENIANHKGFVVSYNLCQCFNGLYHPVWAYYQPLYSIFCSFFINHGGVVKVIKMNILLFAVNVMLIFYIIEKAMPTRFNVMFVFFLGFSINFFVSALYAWTEQLHFFCFILTFILFLKLKDSPAHLFWLGILNAAFMLIRVAHLYNFLAYLPVIFIGKDSMRHKFKRSFFFVCGFILAYGLYQLFCWTTYHTFYPEYARPGASYGLARFYTGIAYDIHKVGLQIPLGPFLTLEHLSYIKQHLMDFLNQMPIFFWPALAYYFLPGKNRLQGGLIELCFFQSAFTVFGYSLTFYWLTYSFDSLRYSMIPYVLMSIVGWYCVYHGLSLSESRVKKLVGGLILAGLLFQQANSFLAIRTNFFETPPWTKPYLKDLLETYEWIDKNSSKEVLVASNEDQHGFFVHRPFISMPLGTSYTCPNLLLYNRIYAPDYYLLSFRISDKCFSSILHTETFSNKSFRIFKVTK